MHSWGGGAHPTLAFDVLAAGGPSAFLHFVLERIAGVVNAGGSASGAGVGDLWAVPGWASARKWSFVNCLQKAIQDGRKAGWE